MLVKDYAIIGEIQCLNCGRTLGEAVRTPGEGMLRIRAAAHQPAPQVKVGAKGSLQCGRCGGRAFVEPEIALRELVDRADHNSVDPLVGAA
jgi:hypothetical protein